jgi:hypothetical protein
LKRNYPRASGYLWDEKYVETDDPRWLISNRDLVSAIHPEWDAAAALVTIQPTTRAGVVALLRYAFEVEDRGAGWPDLEEEGSKHSKKWYLFLMEGLAEALPSAA